MPNARDILERFRPAAAPGRAGPAAVPEDGAARQAAEVAAVLDRLDDAQAIARQVRARAHQRAAELLDEARRQAADLVAAAAAEAVGLRERAVREARRAAAAEAARLRVESDRDAEEVRRRVTARTPGLVARAVALARAGMGEGPAPSGPRPP